MGRLINLLGVKQIAIGVNKMDCDTWGYKQAQYDEIANEMKSMLVKVGWKKDAIEKNTPYLPISGWMGDNLLKKSDKMGWWKGADVKYIDNKLDVHVDTLYDVLDKYCRVPERPTSAPMRMPVSASIRSRALVMFLLVVLSRVWSSLARNACSCPHTRRPTHVSARFSLSRCITLASTLPTQEITWGSTLKASINKTCQEAAMSWSTRKTRRWDRQANSTRRSRCWTSRTRSRSAIHRSALYVVVAQPAGSRRLFGRWGKKLAAKKWTTPIP